MRRLAPAHSYGCLLGDFRILYTTRNIPYRGMTFRQVSVTPCIFTVYFKLEMSPRMSYPTMANVRFPCRMLLDSWAFQTKLSVFITAFAKPRCE